MEDNEEDQDVDLEQVERDIAEARKAAIDAGIVQDPEKHHFYESGERSDIDDPSIAP